MPVNSTHAEYDASATDWSRTRDVLAGEDAVKAAGERYLPRLDSQSEEEYCASRNRAAFFNATARTAEGYSGLIFRRPPFVKTPEAPSGVASLGVGKALGEFINDADMLGTSLFGYAKNVINEVIGVGRAGTDGTGYSKRDARPIISHLAQAMVAKYGGLIGGGSGAVRLTRT